jgi:fermentation-respiration switch protein FrsA (DUF1100 family)
MKTLETSLSRRRVLAAASAITTAGARPAQVLAAVGQPGRQSQGAANMQSVEFPNSGIPMAGNIFTPADFDRQQRYPAIVVVHPGGGVKEQTAGVYAERLAEQGFVTLAFDASHQGASGGLPRYLDDPMRGVGDIYSAVDFLTSLAYVDPARIGALGISAGSGAAVKAASTERRIRALATVSAVDVGASFRKGWEGRAPESDQIATLEAVAKQRTAETAGAAPSYLPYVPQLGDKTAPRDLQEAADYYLTPRGQHPNAPNKMLLESASYMVSFTGFDRVETFLTQPVMIIVGSEAGSLWHSQELHAKAAGPKDFFIVEGATHMDLYDKDVGIAMTRLAPFFTTNL